jgi:hypothetical protein
MKESLLITVPDKFMGFSPQTYAPSDGNFYACANPQQVKYQLN